MSTFTTLTSRLVSLPIDDIDTDQIIPARFLKTTEKAGLGPNLFSDWRYNADGSPRADFALYEPEVQGAQILLAGRNFGCGSSREHAPWALSAWGFRAIIAQSFADIFRGNALKNGVLPLAVGEAMHTRIVRERAGHPEFTVTIELPEQRLLLPGGEAVPFEIDAFAKKCLLHGLDELGYLLTFESEISKHEAKHA
jgi:3-isopropylmalate/(R)-2-methylmalate dehydratase small subunit